MRRADRLFELVQALRGGRLLTARALAEKLEVSTRTIYRDMADLQATGVPIEGEAGVGYVLRGGFDIPPLMFTGDEITALVLGARLVRGWGGHRHGAAAAEALIKIEAVLPEALRPRIERTALFAPDFILSEPVRARLDVLDEALAARCKVRFAYRRADGEASTRRVGPLGLYFWGGVWLLAAWCELREDFRTFRLDRMERLTLTPDTFAPAPGRTLRDFLRKVREESQENASPP